MWTIPALRTKAMREHRVPLSRRALEILEEARTTCSGYAGTNSTCRLSS